MAIEIDPNLAVAHVQLMRFESIKGHDEAVLAQARTVLRLKNADQPPAHQGPGFASMRAQSSGLIGALTGDFAEASEMECAHACPLALQRISQSLFAARLHDITGARLLMRQARAAGAKSNSAAFEARYWIDAQTGDWAAAEADIKAATAADVDENSSKNPRFTAEEQATSYTPLRSLIQARLGDFATAHATIDQTPADCYLCIETRGNLAVAERNWGAAVFWFAKAVQQGPSIPFAYSEWGRMLLAKGDFAGAVAKFAAAHQKGPHFADPLELWGEALMAQNRSDLALAKFAEAAQYAPNWGRLHLKWGEALHWLGRDGDARVQWAAAAKLDLTEVERHTLARLSGSGA
jgi:tetratricopeptide (TPR) repeat protein